MPWLLQVITTMAAIMLVIDLYISWRLNRLGRRAWTRYKNSIVTIWLIIVAFFLLYPVTNLIKYAIWGFSDVYEQPWAPIIYLFWFGLALSSQLIGWILIIDMAAFFQRSSRMKSTTWLCWVYLILFTVVPLYTGYTLYADSTKIHVQHYKVGIDHLPPALEGVKIVHISDVQADRFTRADKIARYVKQVNAQEPDVVLFTGDLVSWGQKYIEEGAEGLSNIKATYGTYAVLGDHDFWAGGDSVANALEKQGIEMLENENHTIAIRPPEGSLRLTGITQVYDRRIGMTQLNTLLEADFDGSIDILFSHQINEQIVERTINRSYELLLAGHTHGGQFAPALTFFPVSAPMLETEYVSGIYKRNGSLININNGLGFTLAPVRLHAPIEISVLELTSGK